MSGSFKTQFQSTYCNRELNDSWALCVKFLLIMTFSSSSMTTSLHIWNIGKWSVLHLLNVKDIFDVQCMKFWYKFENKKLRNYFRDMFKYHHEVHDIGTRGHDRLHLYPTHTSGARNVLRHHLPELLNTFPKYLIDKIETHSLYSISHRIKCYLIDLYSYDCSIIDGISTS